MLFNNTASALEELDNKTAFVSTKDYTVYWPGYSWTAACGESQPATTA